MIPTPQEKRFRLCAEWQRQEAIWLAWPWDEDLWGENFRGAQRGVLDLAQIIQKGGAKIMLLIPPQYEKKNLKEDLYQRNLAPEFWEIPFGDIWLRDITPLFLLNSKGEQATVSFRFNGWGKKYILDGDMEVSQKISQKFNFPNYASDLILEGGAIEGNGQGIGLTTRQCLLNTNRNPEITEEEIGKILKDFLGIQNLIWLDEGLLYDHTDGHIDNIARFISPKAILCMEPSEENDPQKEVLLATVKQLKTSKEVQKQNLEIVTLPSPGCVRDSDGAILPASYLNFLITNDQVAVPTFQKANEEKVLNLIQKLFPGKKITGIECLDLLTGGGTLHCISQPQFKP